jgi:SAM-dependent methyltransferase
MKINFKFIKFLFKESWQGKTIFRILLNYQIMEHCKNINENVLDLGSGIHDNYSQFLDEGIKIIKADIKNNPGIDIVTDLNKIPLPIESNSFDTILCINLIDLLRNPENLLKDVHRILKTEGVIYFSSMFIINLRPEPKDFNRWTSIKIQEELDEIGFGYIKIIPIGERFSACANLIISPIPMKGIFSIFKSFLYLI